jgi:hypothetical protein
MPHARTPISVRQPHTRARADALARIRAVCVHSACHPGRAGGTHADVSEGAVAVEPARMPRRRAKVVPATQLQLPHWDDRTLAARRCNGEGKRPHTRRSSGERRGGGGMRSVRRAFRLVCLCSPGSRPPPTCTCEAELGRRRASERAAAPVRACARVRPTFVGARATDVCWFSCARASGTPCERGGTGGKGGA